MLCADDAVNAKQLGFSDGPYFGCDAADGPDGDKKNELRHSRGAPHTNHIINNTKTNNRVQRYVILSYLQYFPC